MKSAEFSERNDCDEMILTADKRLKGILHLENPIAIKINENSYQDRLKIFADSGEIEILSNVVFQKKPTPSFLSQ